MLAAHELDVRYGRHVALTGVTFSVGPGELVAVVGPNGAGKSTLFKAICGLVPHRGTVQLGGAHCHHRRDRMLAAYIPQRAELDLDFPITVDELTLSGRRRFRAPGRRASRADRVAASAALERVGLEGLGGRPIGSLSGGQLQRAFVARALAQEAHLVLLDEALSGVDLPSTESLLGLFTGLCERGTSLLVATHDLALARRRFDRCLALNGRLVADGPPSSALDQTTVDATFGSGAVVPELACSAG
jgi:ABC-type Mn2+/Zn2+ transport system ATPase subunit